MGQLQTGHGNRSVPRESEVFSNDIGLLGVSATLPKTLGREAGPQKLRSTVVRLPPALQRG
jgi:hypothetical protein